MTLAQELAEAFYVYISALPSEETCWFRDLLYNFQILIAGGCAIFAGAMAWSGMRENTEAIKSVYKDEKLERSNLHKSVISQKKSYHCLNTLQAVDTFKEEIGLLHIAVRVDKDRIDVPREFVFLTESIEKMERALNGALLQNTVFRFQENDLARLEETELVALISLNALVSEAINATKKVNIVMRQPIDTSASKVNADENELYRELVSTLEQKITLVSDKAQKMKEQWSQDIKPENKQD